MEWIMCGIFGFILKEPLQIDIVFRLLEKLEVHKYPQEQKPVGGYGTGIAIIQNDGKVFSKKIGKTNGSPTKHLVKMVGLQEASVLVAHVRMPSEKFMQTAKFAEATQPYVANCFRNLTVVSVHNGYVANYKAIREKLAEHAFESEKVELIDSEVVPHYFEHLLKEKGDTAKALDTLFSSLEGSNTISLLQSEKDSVFLHLLHKGKTRGLTVWANRQKEIVFCSRKEPLLGEFHSVLTERDFKETVSISYGEEKTLKLSFRI